jgi:hypothetical protein
MGSNAIFFAWNRSLPGRERISGEHFQEFSQYLNGLQKKGEISSFEAVFLNPHGGDMNGFFLIRGDSSKLDTLVSTKEWETHMIRAVHHLQGAGAVRAQTGDLIAGRMSIWTENIPR